MVDRLQHWEGVYSGKSADEMSWFQPHAASSLRLIADSADANSHIIDVGGGAPRCWWTNCSTRDTAI